MQILWPIFFVLLGLIPLLIGIYLWILRRIWWRILLFVVCSVAGSVVLSNRLVPVYESTATVDVDRQMPSAIITC